MGTEDSHVGTLIYSVALLFADILSFVMMVIEYGTQTEYGQMMHTNLI